MSRLFLGWIARGMRAALLPLIVVMVAVAPLAHAAGATAGAVIAPMERAALAEGQLPSVSSPDIEIPRGWETRNTRYFRIHSDPVDRASAEFLAAEIDGWMDEAADRVGQPVWGSVDLLLAPSYEAFMAVQPGNAPTWAVGTAYSGLGLITVRAPRAAPAQTDYSLRQTTVHEIAHIVLGWSFGDQHIPRWLHEGLAKYVAGETTWESRIHLSRAVLTGSLIPLGDLASDFPRSNARASLAYAQSLEFLSYLIDEHGTGVIPALIQEMADGVPFNQAITEVTGVPFAELERDWHSDLQLNFAWLPALSTGGGLWVLAAGLLFAGWARKRLESRKRRRQWEIEEALIYGSAYSYANADGMMATSARQTWPSHLRVIDGGKEDIEAPPDETHFAGHEEDEGDLDDDIEVPRFRGYVDDDDEDRPPPGGWLH